MADGFRQTFETNRVCFMWISRCDQIRMFITYMDTFFSQNKEWNLIKSGASFRTLLLPVLIKISTNN